MAETRFHDLRDIFFDKRRAADKDEFFYQGRILRGKNKTQPGAQEIQPESARITMGFQNIFQFFNLTVNGVGRLQRFQDAHFGG